MEYRHSEVIFLKIKNVIIKVPNNYLFILTSPLLFVLIGTAKNISFS